MSLDAYDPTLDPDAVGMDALVNSAPVAYDHLDRALGRVHLDGERPAMRSKLLSVDQLRNLPRLQPMVSQLLDFDTVVLAYGRRGGAKSFAAVDLLASVASGTRWHGHTVTTAPGLFVVAEGAAGLGVRFDAWREQNFNTALPPDRLTIYPDPINLLNYGQVAEFTEMAVEYGAKIIVFDTLARCMVGGDENSARDAGMAVEQLDVIRRHTGACVLVVHHSGKAVDAGARGSSAFEAAADTVLEIGMTDNVVTINCTKQKNHVAPNPTRLRLRAMAESAVLVDYHDDGAVLTQSLLETLEALAAIEIEGGVSSSAWLQSAPGSDRSFYRHRKDLLTLNLVSNVGSEKQPRYQVTVAGAAALPTDCQRLP